MRRFLAALAVMFLIPLSSLGEADLVCREKLPGCLILQMVEAGAFEMDDQPLSARVLAAALPRLLSVTRADEAHYLENFPQADREAFTLNYYRALANCLLCDIRVGGGEYTPSQQKARQVLHLFLDPYSQPEGLKNLALIRSRMTDEAAARLAEHSGTPAAFVEFLVYTDDYQRHVKALRSP